MGATKFSDLIVWQKAYVLSLRVRDLTLTFPEVEHRQAHQMQSASASIPQNIAEGFGRRSPKARRTS